MASSTASPEARAPAPLATRSDTPDPTEGQALVRAPAARLQARTLTVVRWLAIGGQSAAVAFAILVLKFPLPLVPCVSLILLSAGLNVAVALSPAGKRVARPNEAALQLAFDIAQLAGLLYFTGGIANPFCLLLIAPVTLAAATLPLRHVLAITSLAA